MALSVFTTLADEDTARRIARGAVERKLAACVQMDRIESFYECEGIKQDSEIRLMFKTSDEGYHRLADYILSEHPYDEPALWATQTVRGSPSFLDWIDANSAG